MHKTNANNARWFMLREGTDFEPRLVGGVEDPYGAAFEDDNLFFDDGRRVLELTPLSSRTAMLPLPGWAGAGMGEEYFVDPGTMRLKVRRCDKSEEWFPCDGCVVRCAAGLALDRRGYLYVADPGQRAVIVIDPGLQHLEARIPMAGQPVDVAIGADGRVYVADRSGGRILVYSSRFAPLGSWVTRNADGLPDTPRPIAVTVGTDGNIIVADASHPRLLQFSPVGESLSDLEMPAATAPSAPPCDCLPKVGPCPDRGCRDDRVRDAFDAAMDKHREYRLGHLRLNRSFAGSGVWVSAMLDSGRHDTTWHRLEFDVALPDGCSIAVQTATSNTRDDLASPAWTPEGTEEDPLVYVDGGAPDVLIRSGPGRFMRIRLSLSSNARGTPSVRAVRVLFPRNSYLNSLPRIYRATMGSGRFLEQYLALFEYALTRLEDRYERFSRWLDPEAAPAGMVGWLAGLLDLAFDKDWPLERRRALLLRINDLYRIKGTPRGLVEYIRAYTGVESSIQEDFLRRPGQPSYLGRRGFVLGMGSLITSASPERRADEAMFEAFAHRFSVLVYLKGPDCSGRMLGVIERIVAANKPAHTVHKIVPVYPGTRLDTSATVGIGLVLGGRSMPRAVVGGCGDASSVPESQLGRNMVLGDLNPAFPRPRGHRL